MDFNATKAMNVSNSDLILGCAINPHICLIKPFTLRKNAHFLPFGKVVDNDVSLKQNYSGTFFRTVSVTSSAHVFYFIVQKGIPIQFSVAS